MMIIFGDKYVFSEIDFKMLSKKNVIPISLSYKNRSDQDILGQLELLLKTHKTIVLNTSADVSDEVVKYLIQLELDNIIFYTIEEMLEQYLCKCYISENDTSLQYLVDIHAYTTWQYIQKRIVDYVFIFIIFILVFPILIYSRRKIKKESIGSSMYKQSRVGLGGKEFKCLKYRSMDSNAEDEGPQFASVEDGRAFEWGAKMRKTRIDELPQLLNVLRGEMHLVGPRPERKFWIDKFEDSIPYYNQRHIVRPGITGLAQVKYPYGATIEDTRQKLMHDLFYIKNWSLWLECKVLYHTFWIVLRREGR